MQPDRYWKIAPKWKGQPAFVIGGGTSVTPEMIEAVKGRNVVVVNQSYQAAMWAPILFFADQRWWVREARERPQHLSSFKGLIATTSRQASGDRLLRLRRLIPSADVPPKRDSVRLRRTGLLSAMDICYHRGASEIVLLGADNRDGEDGRAHHHTEYPWPRPKNTWDVKIEDMRCGAVSFRDAGVPITNCSPITTLKFWPVQPLEEVLTRIDKEYEA